MSTARHPYVVFLGPDRVGSGALAEVAVAAKRAGGDRPRNVLVFKVESGEIVDLDLQGSFSEVTARYARHVGPRRGRPKLGVTAKEITLMPRHWDWLARQPGGASATLRRMIDAARKVSEPADRKLAARDATYRFMHAIAGDRPGFEEAARALFRGEEMKLQARIAAWPPDIRLHILDRLRDDVPTPDDPLA